MPTENGVTYDPNTQHKSKLEKLLTDLFFFGWIAGLLGLFGWWIEGEWIYWTFAVCVLIFGMVCAHYYRKDYKDWDDPALHHIDHVTRKK